MSFFSWLRSLFRDAALAGMQDAIEVATNGGEDHSHQAEKFRLTLEPVDKKIANKKK